MQNIGAQTYMAVLAMGGYFLKNPPNTAHCCPTSMAILVRGEGTSSKILPMQPIAAHTYMAVSYRGGNSSKFLPLQPTIAHSYMVILVRGVGNSSESSHCRALEPKLRWQT